MISLNIKKVVSRKATVMNANEIELFRSGPLSINKSSSFVESRDRNYYFYTMALFL